MVEILKRCAVENALETNRKGCVKVALDEAVEREFAIAGMVDLMLDRRSRTLVISVRASMYFLQTNGVFSNVAIARLKVWSTGEAEGVEAVRLTGLKAATSG